MSIWGRSIKLGGTALVAAAIILSFAGASSASESTASVSTASVSTASVTTANLSMQAEDYPARSDQASGADTASSPPSLDTLPAGISVDVVISADPPAALVFDMVAPVEAPVDSPSLVDAPVIAAPVPVPVPVPELAVAQAQLPPLAAALRDILAADSASSVARSQPGQTPAIAQRREREAIASFYAARDFEPLWLKGGAGLTEWTPAARSALRRIERARDDGLDVSQYAVAALPAKDLAADLAADLAILASAELGLSRAVVGYARQASGSRIDPRSISVLITAKPETADPADVLLALSSSPEAGEILRAYNPPHAEYRALRDKLAEVRRESPPLVARARIEPGPVLKIGMKDPRVPLIRARFGVDVNEAAPDSALVYDTRVASRVAEFQRANGLPASGALTARTISALSGGQPAQLEGEIIANMERWRWLPRDLGATRVEVNIPDYQVKVTRNEKIVHRARVVVGKVETQTPIFSDAMEYLVVNPYWNVPPSILRKEMLPAFQKDPAYFTKRGYEVVRRGGNISVRQPPGERNALGQIKFMFPNDHAVYLHDTPSRALFANPRRAYSHGCVRVDKPFALAEVLLPEGWSEQRLRKMVGGSGEKTVRLTTHIPVHLQYFTIFTDEAGKLQVREDIYGHSRKVRIALGL